MQVGAKREFLAGVVLATALLPAVGGESMPAEVQQFIERREGCDHMRGEVPDPPDKRTLQALQREIQQLCKGTDKELMQLKRKYQSNSLVRQRLADFEPDIEPLAVATGRAAKPRQ